MTTTESKANSALHTATGPLCRNEPEAWHHLTCHRRRRCVFLDCLLAACYVEPLRSHAAACCSLGQTNTWSRSRSGRERLEQPSLSSTSRHSSSEPQLQQFILPVLSLAMEECSSTGITSCFCLHCRYVLKKVRLARQSEWQRKASFTEMEVVRCFQKLAEPSTYHNARHTCLQLPFLDTSEAAFGTAS